jgi:hypothetical protein
MPQFSLFALAHVFDLRIQVRDVEQFGPTFT